MNFRNTFVHEKHEKTRTKATADVDLLMSAASGFSRRELDLHFVLFVSFVDHKGF
jgi:hypothetical protein